MGNRRIFFSEFLLDFAQLLCNNRTLFCFFIQNAFRLPQIAQSLAPKMLDL
ncbi:hypothetical protein F441_02940 [Phytophthora nicotianae CJ01A1]|uniref:Uncharacterized protein n=1 Tax=Phytophthora nicotianae CJ01A1 TaxID=1317063 RepID=W2XQ04_PHYNI|nr:hypothetical protein F441_02940 [Phytophthora nicotianae CJ01A1]